MPEQSGADPFRPDGLHQFLLRHPPATTYHIAYSGGLDSTVLLHLCCSVRKENRGYHFRAIHVHHGLQANADGWAQHCQQVCTHLGLPLDILRVHARKQVGQSPEEAARNARYEAIRGLMKPGDGLLTAQHQDDQAETLLLQLFRGAGLQGLAAMADAMPYFDGQLLRPLLRTPRETIRAYADAHRLDWIEDPSNSSEDFDRNFLRQRIMPQLKARWPGINRTLSRSAFHCAEAHQLLDTQAQALMATLVTPDDKGRLPIVPMRALSRAEQKLALRKWLHRHGYRMPPTRIMNGILTEIQADDPDRTPRIHWPEGEIRRYRNELFLLPPLNAPPPPSAQTWDGIHPLTLAFGNGSVIAEATTGDGIRMSLWKTGHISIRGRTGGEKLRLPGRQGTHALKKLFQEAGIPSWVRDHVPLVYLDGTLAAMAMPFRVSIDVAARASEPGVILRWIGPSWIPEYTP